MAKNKATVAAQAAKAKAKVAANRGETPPEIELRSKQFNEWPVKGRTSDRGLGSSAKRLAMELDPDRLSSAVVKTYERVVKATEKLTPTEAQFVLVAAACGYTFDAVLEAARNGDVAAGKAKINPTDQTIIDALLEDGDEEGAKALSELLLRGKQAAKDQGKSLRKRSEDDDSEESEDETEDSDTEETEDEDGDFESDEADDEDDD